MRLLKDFPLTSTGKVSGLVESGEMILESVVKGSRRAVIGALEILVPWAIDYQQWILKP